MKKLNTLVCISLLAFANLYAFDGERKGFILGAGIGAGYLGGGIGAGFLFNTTSFNSFSETDGRTVLITNFKIGYAPSNTLEIYYTSKISWWGESDINFILGLSAIAATVYTDYRAETGWFVSGGLGLSTLDAPFENDFESVNGLGLFIGGGYEFSSHWNLEVDFLYSTIAEGGTHFNSGVLVTINVLAF